MRHEQWAYYTLVGQKDAEGIKQYLHPDVEFYGPLSTSKGKEAVVKATSGFRIILVWLRPCVFNNKGIQ